MCAEINATNALPGLIELHTNNIISGTPQAHIPQARQAQRRRGGTSGTVPVLCRMALRLSGLRDPPAGLYCAAE